MRGASSSVSKSCDSVVTLGCIGMTAIESISFSGAEEGRTYTVRTQTCAALSRALRVPIQGSKVRRADTILHPPSLITPEWLMSWPSNSPAAQILRQYNVTHLTTGACYMLSLVCNLQIQLLWHPASRPTYLGEAADPISMHFPPVSSYWALVIDPGHMTVQPKVAVWSMLVFCRLMWYLTRSLDLTLPSCHTNLSAGKCRSALLSMRI